MNYVEENESKLSQLMCYMDAIFIDWDDTESCADIAKAIQLAKFETPLKPFEKHKRYIQN